MDRKAKLDYLLSKIEVRDNNFDGCWLYTGTITPNGYGMAPWSQLAHVAMFELARGARRDGYQIAHTVCKTKRCINPWHLSQLTVSEHRKHDGGNQYKNATHCIRGHEFTEENTRHTEQGYRYCRACARDRTRAYRARIWTKGG